MEKITEEMGLHKEWLVCDLFEHDFLFLKNKHYLKCKSCENAVRRTKRGWDAEAVMTEEELKERLKHER